MIQLSNKIKPSEEVLNGLAAYQSLIVGSFAEKQALAKTKFSSYNRKRNPNFDAVKTALTDGIALFINPRTENGMDFCKLNLLSFHFEITAPKGTFDYESADYTFNTVLCLNTQREYLRQARENAYGMYKTRLFYYFKNKSIVPKAQLDKMIAELQKESHITVWKEMQRAYNNGILAKLDIELNKLFQSIPESLNG
ncbi:MAG: hypothetical protein RI894_1671 [Bacteroidota bacterium]|jgi:hypothetical protein